MAQVSVSQTLHTQNQIETNTNSKSQGTLKTATGEMAVDFISESESISKGASEFLQEMNKLPEDLSEVLDQHSFVFFSQETIETELEILDFLKALETVEPLKEESGKTSAQGKTPSNKTPVQENQKNNSLQKGESQEQKPAEKIVYSSLFSLARSFNQTLNTSKKEASHKPQEKNENSRQLNTQTSAIEKQSQIETRFDKQENKDKNEERGKEKGHDQGSGSEEEKKRRQKRGLDENKRKITGVSAARSANPQANRASSSSGSRGTEHVQSIESLYIRFMALMARILGQAEAEAHDLYLRIKERTDSVDVLTLLISKINSEKGTIDWTKNEEMKALIEKARQIGVDIPQGKYKWTEDEKKLLKENIQMRKDSMEKVTQLERTDMQRFLQEASQCHQARSNVLKLLKEVMDTIIANMRP